MKRAILRMLLTPETTPVAMLIFTLVVGIILSPQFLDAGYLLDKTSLFVPIGFMALALTFVITAGHIDLSVASGSVLVMVIAARLFESGMPMALVIPASLAVGALLGFVNGTSIVLLRVPALVFTLGTLALYRGIAQMLLPSRSIPDTSAPPEQRVSFPNWFVGVDGIDRKIVGLIPLPLVMLILAAVAATVLLKSTTFGRKVIAVGTNEEAARFSAVRTDAITVAVFVLSGLAMSVAALLVMSMHASADRMQFQNQELVAITAVVLGGTSIFGGRGSVPGSLIALLLLATVDSALGMGNVPAEGRLAINGVLLVAAVLLSEWTGRLRRRLRISEVTQPLTTQGSES